MKTTPVVPGQVLLVWRMNHDWRNGDPSDRRWRRYSRCALKEAEHFMKNKAPYDTMFEYRIKP